MTTYFNQCFTEQDNSYFKNMMKIIDRSKKYRNTEKYLEKHHIVPKAWFKYHKFEIDSSDENLVYLSCRDHLRIHVILYYYFDLVKDVKMKEKTLSAIYFMTQSGSIQLRNCGYMSESEYDEYERLRLEYYESGLYKNRKYTDEYLRQCFDIYRQYDDPYEAHRQVVEQMGFEYDRRRTLQERLKKYIPKEEYDSVIRRQMEYLRNLQKERTKERAEEKMKEKELQTQKYIEELKSMYDCYLKYGVRYMKFKFPKFNTFYFLKKCSNNGIIDYKPSKTTKKLKIKFKGKEYGLNELERELGVVGKNGTISKLHSNSGLSYEYIFECLENGTFEQLKVCDKVKDGCKSGVGSFQKIVNEGFFREPLVEDYVMMCDMDLSGIPFEDIKKWYFDMVYDRLNPSLSCEFRQEME